MMMIFVAMAMVMVRMGLGMYVAGSVLCTTKSHVRKKTGSNVTFSLETTEMDDSYREDYGCRRTAKSCLARARSS